MKAELMVLQERWFWTVPTLDCPVVRGWTGKFWSFHYMQPPKRLAIGEPHVVSKLVQRRNVPITIQFQCTIQLYRLFQLLSKIIPVCSMFFFSDSPSRKLCHISFQAQADRPEADGVIWWVTCWVTQPTKIKGFNQKNNGDLTRSN